MGVAAGGGEPWGAPLRVDDGGGEGDRFAERLIGSLRREWLDHIVNLGEFS